jgi:hypothetical protein
VSISLRGGEVRSSETFSSGGAEAARERRIAGASGVCPSGLRGPNLMFPGFAAIQERVDTGTTCSVRLSWRLRARPSATLHEIQICREADWNR